jgi:hypothetical protein
MKKLITIPIIILILFSGITVNLAFHYCGGQIAEKKISLTDSHGSCGMEGDSQHKNAGMSSLCCSDRVSSYTFNNTYLPSLGAKEDAIDVELPVLEIFSISIVEASNLTHEALGSPPGPYSPSFVDLDSICILRI